MFTTAIKYMARKPKPEIRPIELKTPPEQTQTITRVIFDILKEHGPLTIAETWERVQGVGVRGLTRKRHMRTILRWMRERQKLRQICIHVGPNKQYLYTTWFTKNNINQTARPGINSAIPKSVLRMWESVLRKDIQLKPVNDYTYGKIRFQRVTNTA